MRRLASLLVLSLTLSLALPAVAEEAPQRIRLTNVEARPAGIDLAADKIVIDPLPPLLPPPGTDVRPVPAPIVEQGEKEKLSLEMEEWLRHRDLKLERRLQRGGEVGGIGAFGMRLGGKGDVTPGAFPPEVVASLQDWDNDGALVVSVTPGAAAELAGLQPGDVIVRFAGLWVDSVPTMIRMASRSQPGDEHEIWFLRDGELQRTWAVVMDRVEVMSLAEANAQP